MVSEKKRERVIVEDGIDYVCDICGEVYRRKESALACELQGVDGPDLEVGGFYIDRAGIPFQVVKVTENGHLRSYVLRYWNGIEEPTAKADFECTPWQGQWDTQMKLFIDLAEAWASKKNAADMEKWTAALAESRGARKARA